MKKIFFFLLILCMAGIGCKKEMPATTTPPVVVLPPAVNNKPPVAKAGDDITLIMPMDSVILNGSASYDSTGIITTYWWYLISGTNAFAQIVSPTKAQTLVRNLTEGTHGFVLNVTNNKGVSKEDTVLVTVLSACNATRKFISHKSTLVSTLPVPLVNTVEVLTIGNKMLAWGEYWSGYSLYDAVTNSWTHIIPPSGLISVFGFTPIAVDGKIYFAGGFQNSYPLITSKVVWVYDIATKLWSNLNLSEPRGYIKAAVWGDKIYFSGGVKSDMSMSGRVDIYNTTTKTWTNTELKGAPRALGEAIASEGKIFFIGGSLKLEDGPMGFDFYDETKEIDILNVSNGEWSTYKLDKVRVNFATAVADGKLYLVGGGSSFWGPYLTDIEVIDAQTLSRTQLNFCDAHLSYSQAYSYKKDYLIFYRGLKQIDVYNKTTGEWKFLTIGNSVNTHGRIAVLNESLYWMSVTNGQLYKIDF